MFNRPECCNVPMWLMKVELGDIADHQTFECKVCDAILNRTVAHETPVSHSGSVEPAVGAR